MRVASPMDVSQVHSMEASVSRAEGRESTEMLSKEMGDENKTT